MINKRLNKRALVIKLRLFFLAINCFFFFILFISCATLPSLDKEHIRKDVQLYSEEWEWKEIGAGISFLYYKNKNIPLQWNMAKVELNTKSLDLVAYPSEKDMENDGTNRGLKVKDFLKQNESVIAINATPFSYPKGRLSSKRRLVGLYINDGMILSPAIEKYAALAFFATEDSGYKAKIYDSQVQVPNNADYAFGGFFTILKNGEILSFKNYSFDSRLAVGINETQDTLYVLFAQGERKTKSTGLTFEECALILQKAGATDALQLDGGGSACLEIKNESLSSYKGRYVANIFGFKAFF